MKKTFVAFFLVVMLFPAAAFAQTTPTHDQLVLQLIALLQKEIQVLQAQLITLQNNAATTVRIQASSTQPVATSTTGVTTGSVPELDVCSTNAKFTPACAK